MGLQKPPEDTEKGENPGSESALADTSSRNTDFNTNKHTSDHQSKTVIEISSSNSSTCTPDADEDTSRHLHGWRLHALTLSLCVGLFLSLLETTILSTSLLSIIDELHEQERSSWVVTAYLLTYTGFTIPLAKLSDIYGRRPVLTGSFVLFIAASAGCGWSRSMKELCVFRAFQGIGGGGMFALTFIIVVDMVPNSMTARYSTIISSAFAIANLLGPIFGGVINEHTTWRWIFWLNLPGGALALTLCWFALPAHYPYHRLAPSERPQLNLANLKRIDFLGILLILSGTCLLVACLEVGGGQYEWSSATSLCLLIVSILCFILLVFWQYAQSRRKTVQEPVLPWRILTNRFAMGALLSALCWGAGLFAIVINLPLRFQIVDGETPLAAAYRILPVTVVSPLGSIITGILAQRGRIRPLWLLLIGGCLQTLGMALYAGIDAGSLTQNTSQWGFEVILGLGLGMTLNTAVILIPNVCQPQDKAIGMAFIGQFRSLGGSIGIAACANLLNKALGDDLRGSVEKGLLTPEQVAGLRQNAALVKTLPDEARAEFVGAYADGFQKEMWLVTGFCAACIIAAGMLIETKTRKIR